MEDKIIKFNFKKLQKSLEFIEKPAYKQEVSLLIKKYKKSNQNDFISISKLLELNVHFNNMIAVLGIKNKDLQKTQELLSRPINKQILSGL